jgi:hypothetical protein
VLGPGHRQGPAWLAAKGVSVQMQEERRQGGLTSRDNPAASSLSVAPARLSGIGEAPLQALFATPAGFCRSANPPLWRAETAPGTLARVFQNPSGLRGLAALRATKRAVE